MMKVPKERRMDIVVWLMWIFLAAKRMERRSMWKGCKLCVWLVNWD